MKKIIVIEDDKHIRDELENFLKKYNYNVVAPKNFENIMEFILNEKSDLILLDINLPVYDGYYICKEVRKKSNVPIIIVTSKDGDMDELMSINLGADDFITKPYNVQILLARIGALFKRIDGNSANILICRDFKLNLSNAKVLYKDNEIDLTKNEVKILSFLIENKGKIVSRNMLMEYLWSSDYFVDDSTLSVNMTRLRKKLESIGINDVIETKRGLGYIIS